jgi:hypothetical protein
MQFAVRVLGSLPPSYDGSSSFQHSSCFATSVDGWNCAGSGNNYHSKVDICCHFNEWILRPVSGVPYNLLLTRCTTCTLVHCPF